MIILFGIPPIHHVEISLGEVSGLKELGYNCYTTQFGINNTEASLFSRLWGVMRNSFSIIGKLYQTKPHLLYLNSRVEPVAAVRDFITIFIVKLFYHKRLKIAIKSHGSEYSHLKSNSFLYKKVINPYLKRNVDAWLMLSKEEQELMRHFISIPNRVFVTTNIVSDFEISDSGEVHDFLNKLPKDKFIVLFCGRIIKEKGCFDIVDSIPFIKDIDEMVFIFLGDGPELPTIRNIVEERCIQKHFLFTGWVDEAVSNSFFSRVNILLYPSFSEGFSMVLFRAVASGIPVITTRIRAAADYLKEPDNVLWVNIMRPHEIGMAVTKLFEDHGLRSRMSENNKQLGRMFNKMNTCKNLSEIFESICA